MISKKEIYPGINVYSNCFKNPELFLKKAISLDGWENWSIFGKMLSLKIETKKFNDFPKKEQWKDLLRFNKNNGAKELIIELDDIFYDVTKDYIEQNNIKSNNFIYKSPSVNEYLENVEHFPGYSMHFHTDFNEWDKESPGDKFFLTVTSYLNDDYQGGEICFFVDKKLISYKPKAGEVIVFPSNFPYLHGVRTSLGNKRYMIRQFWYYNQKASEKWEKNNNLYGEEVWAKMEEERIAKERSEDTSDKKTIKLMLKLTEEVFGKK